MKYSRFLLLFLILALSPALQAQESNYRILFLSDHEGNWHLYTMQTDGTDIEILVDSEFEEGGRITFASLSPDGRTLAVSSRNARPEIDPAYHADEIFLLDMITGIIIQLTDDARHNSEPQWSPDSQYLAYLTGNGINGFNTLNVFDTVSESTTVVATSNGIASSVVDNLVPVFRGFDWSPDGQQIVLSGQVGLPEGYNILLLVNADGTEAQQITSHETDAGPSVAWGAEANMIYANCGNRDNPYEGHEICQLNLETLEFVPVTQLQSLIPDEENPYIFGLDVNPDGEFIFVYEVGIDSDPSSIYWFNSLDENTPTLVAEIASFRQFIGWIALPE